MAFPIIPKRRSGASGNPTTLNLGELAVNTQTGELFLGADGGVTLLNGPVAAGTTVTEHTGDGTTTAFTFAGYNGTADGGYLVSVGGIDQPPSKYAITSTAGGTITFVEAPVSGELISIRAIVSGSGGGGGTGTVTSITAGTGLDGGTITDSGTISLTSVTTAQSNVGSSTAIPVLSINDQGQVTSLGTAAFVGLTTAQIAGLATTAPAALSTTASAGLSTFAARADHAHLLPSAADVGALGATAAAGGDLTGNFPSPALAAITTAQNAVGSSVAIPVLSIDAKGRVTSLTTTEISALTTNQIAGLATSEPAALSTAAFAGLSTFAARGDHQHLLPTATEVGALGATAAASGDLTGNYPGPTLAAITTAQSNIGSSTVVPVLSVDAKGRVTSLTTAAISAATTSAISSLTGDVTAIGPGAAAATLAAITTAQSNVGSSTEIPVISIDAKGRVTALSSTTVSLPYIADVLIVAGGGGGGGAGGGGGGGVIVQSSVTFIAGSSNTIIIGAGGAGIIGTSGSSSPASNSGQNTTAFGFTAIAGGGGGAWSTSADNQNGVSGGSGGGGGLNNVGALNAGGAATSGQGFAGGSANHAIATGYGAAGGGGAGAVGGNATGAIGGAGGAGILNAFNGSSLYWAGGGGGGTQSASAAAGNGGIGGGGGGANGMTGPSGTGGGSALNSGSNGSSGTNNVGGNGGANTGGGGGAMGVSFKTSGQGGSGIVVLRYLGAQRGTGGTVTSVGGYTIHTFLSSATYIA
jgi:hypothetical protein